jgi:sugar/nucleoside kinase (ribokinase family)
MHYDAEEQLIGGLTTSSDDWTRLLDQPLPLPADYRQPRAMHLVTEFPDEPMVGTAIEMREQGVLLSLEPLAAGPSAMDWDRMLALIRGVDIVCPDWPTASRVAESQDPRAVLRAWSALGPELVAVRHGARGSYVWSQEHDEAWHIPAVAARVVDPTGAGNAYGGGLCVGWTSTRDARRAGSCGTISASIVVRQVGLPAMSAELEHEARALLDRALLNASRL